ncbi:MAG: helix-turn-helix transcriptional regulator [Gammaproteobacteria bacterium]|nr:helix-turn-helix transcriptional regulator [Gammaproteobacteria bacterium]
MKYQQRVEIFRERIAEVIAASGLNHSRFAASIGVDRSTLSQLLSRSNLRLPRADTVAAIAEKYQVSIDWLLGLTNQGALGADLLPGPLEFEDFSESSANKRLLQWHQEASDYKVRYIPATLPDLCKIEEVAGYEFRRYGMGRTDQSIRDTHVLLIQQRREQSEMEVCQSRQDIEGFARGEGIWCDLSPQIRSKQLEHMAMLVEELYPRFRWFLFDGREIHTAAFTLFGPLRAVIFLGQSYLLLNSTEHIRLLSRRFDELIRNAVIQPNEIADYLRGLMQEIDS